jgi:DNA-binding CsgD family transcriptional regulator
MTELLTNTSTQPSSKRARVKKLPFKTNLLADRDVISDRQAKVLDSWYKGQSVQEIAQKFGMNEQQARSAVNAAVSDVESVARVELKPHYAPITA